MPKGGPCAVLENGALEASARADEGLGSVVVTAGGSRGTLVLTLGALLADPEETDHLVYEPTGDDEPAAAMFFALTRGERLSVQTVYSLEPGAERLGVEVRLSNRSLEPVPVSLGAAFHVDGREPQELPLAFGSLAPRDAVTLRFEAGASEALAPAPVALPSLPPIPNDHPPESLPITSRGAAHLRTARAASRAGDSRKAIESVDAALGTLGEDELAWWHRAVLARLLGERDEESPELTAAHALSPLEPVLKAEAFLSMPQTHGREPHPILAPLAARPEAMAECVGLYVEAGLFQEASRLIDEALRHAERPMLRYLLAWMLLTGTRMEMEAAGELAKAAKSGPQASAPWRPLEVRAVEELAARFPEDSALQAVLAKRNGPAD